MFELSTICSPATRQVVGWRGRSARIPETVASGLKQSTSTPFMSTRVVEDNKEGVGAHRDLVGNDDDTVVLPRFRPSYR